MRLSSFLQRLVSRGVLTVFLCVSSVGCEPAADPDPLPEHFRIRGGWLAAREGYPLDSAHGTAVLEQMRRAGVRYVAIGEEVTMPSMGSPVLEWGKHDDALRGILRRVKALGLSAFLLPRIESPDFFRPPYPFRADIRFASAAEWEEFHAGMERMLLHYAALAQSEGVALFGLGLELKQSVRGFPARWRRIIERVRRVFRGSLTYSANWYEEWQHVAFWDDLDFIGVGAYFELKGATGTVGPASTEELVRRWAPILAELERVSAARGKPVLFTEVGYTGYADCAERPWEWAGKQDRGVAIDHAAQARAHAALFRVVRSRRFLAGLFVWTFYTDAQQIEPWEYGVQGRPAAAALRRAYGGSR